MISKEEVQHIAKLARLELTEPETEKMQKDMSAILDYFALLKKAKTAKNIKKLESRIQNLEKVTRKDKAEQKPSKLTDALVQMAPDKKDDYIKVKSIL